MRVKHRHGGPARPLEHIKQLTDRVHLLLRRGSLGDEAPAGSALCWPGAACWAAGALQSCVASALVRTLWGTQAEHGGQTRAKRSEAAILRLHRPSSIRMVPPPSTTPPHVEVRGLAAPQCLATCNRHETASRRVTHLHRHRRWPAESPHAPTPTCHTAMTLRTVVLQLSATRSAFCLPPPPPPALAKSNRTSLRNQICPQKASTAAMQRSATTGTGEDAK